MSFSKHLLSSVLLAGTVFVTATLPLVTLGSKPVAIQLEGKPVFVGQFKDMAGLYLSLALTLSIGTGATHLAVMRWYHSARKLGLVENQMTTLKQQLAEKEVLIESLSFSPSRLQASGLERFLSDEALINRLQRSQVSANSEAIVGRSEQPQVVLKSST
jgi:hypothetical protein